MNIEIAAELFRELEKYKSRRRDAKLMSDVVTTTRDGAEIEFKGRKMLLTFEILGVVIDLYSQRIKEITEKIESL